VAAVAWLTVLGGLLWQTQRIEELPPPEPATRKAASDLIGGSPLSTGPATSGQNSGTASSPDESLPTPAPRIEAVDDPPIPKGGRVVGRVTSTRDGTPVIGCEIRIRKFKGTRRPPETMDDFLEEIRNDLPEVRSAGGGDHFPIYVDLPRTDREGRFQVHWLSPEPCSVRFRDSEFLDRTVEPVYVTEGADTPLEIALEPNPLSRSAAPYGRLLVEVVDNLGAPRPRVSVSVTPGRDRDESDPRMGRPKAKTWAESGMTGADGLAVFDLPPGVCEVTLAGWDWAAQAPREALISSSGEARVRLVAEDGTLLRVRTEDSDGHPVPNATLELHDRDGRLIATRGPVVPHSVRLVPGDYRVTVRAPGFEDTAIVVRVLMQSIQELVMKARRVDAPR
jgi:hypothetical protein